MTEPSDVGPTVVTMPERKNELAAAGEQFKRDLPILIAHQVQIAKIRRAAYLAYVEAGFTPAQALELCCK